jgi:hypothetical protein
MNDKKRLTNFQYHQKNLVVKDFNDFKVSHLNKGDASNKKKKSVICASDLNSLDLKRGKPGRIAIPMRSSLITPSDLKDLSFSKEKTESFCQSTISPCFSDDFKTSKQLASDIRRCFSELREEAEHCLSSSRSNIRSYTGRHRTDLESRESLESDSKDSFTTKTPLSGDFLDGSPIARGGDMVEMKLKIEMLMNKMNRSETEAKEHEMENQKLKQIISSLEHKIEDYKMYHDNKGVSCSGNCIII